MASTDDDDVFGPMHCKCGHRVKWWVKGAPHDDWFGESMRAAGLPDDLHQQTDVVERACPHGNGTVLEQCPKCDRVVDLWGCGPAGGMECWCWEAGWRRWLGRLLDAVTFGRWERWRRRYALWRIARYLARGER